MEKVKPTTHTAVGTIKAFVIDPSESSSMSWNKAHVLHPNGWLLLQKLLQLRPRLPDHLLPRDHPDVVWMPHGLTYEAFDLPLPY